MLTRKSLNCWLWVGFFLAACFPLAAAHGQEINLDRMEKCGDLLCYQSLKDPNLYYYLPDQPRLAVKNGLPQFSFLKYARTSKTGRAGIGRAAGGGIVHFLVTYGVDEARLRAAGKALQERHPEAHIAGPIVYRKGSFALITSFNKGASGLTRTVAVGKAPLMEGQKAAVSMALSREGAELLWESFKSPTPDISLVFDMQFAGVREPYEATLEADWKRIVNHQRLKAGIKYAWFGADVDMLFQELRQSGAVKITTKGKDVNLDRILQSANDKLLHLMFDPAPVDELTRAAAEKDSYSSLNQAVKLLRDAAASRRRRRSELLPQPHPGALNWLASLLGGVPEALAGQKPDPEATLAKAREIFEAGHKLAKENRYEEAIEKCKEANRLYIQAKGKESPGCLGSIGWCLLELHRPEAAIPYLQRAIDLATKDSMRALALYNLGCAFYRLNRCPQAAEAYRAALSLLERNDLMADAYWYLARCLEKLGQYTEALACYRSAASYGPETKFGREASQQAGLIAAKVYNKARQLDEAARQSGYQAGATQEALMAYQTYLQDGKPAGQRAVEVKGRIRFLQHKLLEAEKAPAGGQVEKIPGKAGTPKLTGGKAGVGENRRTPGKTALKARASKPAVSRSAPTARSRVGKSAAVARGRAGTRKPAAASKKARPRTRKRSLAAKKRSQGMPGFSLVASYRLKRIKRSGRLVYHMNHYRTESQAFAMTENIGDLYRRYGADPRVFRAVNIDDPVFKQREILVTLDGQDSSTFSKHLNFVTVEMKKVHQSGEVTTDEVVITPKKFNHRGNAFELSYGWKGDSDRSAWLNYQVQTVWSFHGGIEVRTPWRSHSEPMLALQPPYRYRTLTIEGEGEKLTRAGVRHAVVTVTTQVGGRLLATQTTIRNRGPAPSLLLEIPEDRQAPPVQVAITWYLRGGKKISMPGRTVEGDIIYWDELPERGI